MLVPGPTETGGLSTAGPRKLGIDWASTNDWTAAAAGCMALSSKTFKKVEEYGNRLPVGLVLELHNRVHHPNAAIVMDCVIYLEKHRAQPATPGLV